MHLLQQHTKYGVCQNARHDPVTTNQQAVHLFGLKNKKLLVHSSNELKAKPPMKVIGMNAMTQIVTKVPIEKKMCNQ